MFYFIKGKSNIFFVLLNACETGVHIPWLPILLLRGCNSSVKKHLTMSHHNSQYIEAKIIKRENDPANLRLYEAFYIRKYKSELNSREEYTELRDLLIWLDHQHFITPPLISYCAFHCPYYKFLLTVASTSLLSYSGTFFLTLPGDAVDRRKLEVKQCTIQGSYRSWKTWKVMEFYDFIFQAWKVMEFRCGSWKVIGKWYWLQKITNLGRFSCQLKHNYMEMMIIFL